MDERVQKYEQKMTKTLKGFEEELTTIRAGRANPHILDKIIVDYYGSTDTDPAGGKHHCTGSTYDSDPAMGNKSDQRRSKKQSLHLILV